MSLLKQQGIVHLLSVLTIGFLALILISSFTPITRNYNDGKSNVSGVYLARDEDSGLDSSNSGSGKSGNSNSTVLISPPVKTEIREGNLRTKYEVKNREIKIETKVKKGEDEIEPEDEAEDEALEDAENEMEKEDIKVATAPGQVALIQKRIGALTNFPLSVSPATRELTVTTPAGIKVVTVLPQEAVGNMLAGRVMDDVISEKVDNSLASVPNMVKLETENGVLGYKVKGTKTHKLLGFIPIKTKVEAFVSAENGQVVESSQSLLGRILNRIAP